MIVSVKYIYMNNLLVCQDSPYWKVFCCQSTNVLPNPCFNTCGVTFCDEIAIGKSYLYSHIYLLKFPYVANNCQNMFNLTNAGNLPLHHCCSVFIGWTYYIIQRQIPLYFILTEDVHKRQTNIYQFWVVHHYHAVAKLATS